MIGEYLSCTGADCRARDAFGKCPFDYIRDTEGWMDSGYFSEEVRARLKGTSNAPLFSHDYMLVFFFFTYPDSIWPEASKRLDQVHITSCQDNKTKALILT